MENLHLIDTLSDAPPYEVDVFLSDTPWGAEEAQPNRSQQVKVTLPPLMEAACKALYAILRDEEEIEARLGLSPLVECWEMDLTFVNDAEIQELNKTYRDKDQATDVLTFTLFAESEMRQVLGGLPVIQLGSVFVSLEWAWRECKRLASERPELAWPELSGNDNETLPDVFIHYVLTRFIHGLLHLVGINHDTMEAYNKVVSIQERVLHEVFGTAIQTV